MSNMNAKVLAEKRNLRKRRTSAKLHGSAKRPRLVVTVTNRQIKALMVNDDKHAILASADSSKITGTMTEQASAVGTAIAEDAQKNKIKAVVFDRGYKQYHGRVKALAEAARKAGLEF